MTPQELVKAQLWRCSVKKFDSTKTIPADVWSALEETLVLSPSSFGLQPWKFLVVESAEVKKKLTPHSWGQTQVEDCSHLVVFTYRNNMDEAYVQRYVDDIAKTRGIPVEKVDGFKKVMLDFLFKGNLNYTEWARKQGYIALGNFMTSAACLGIDTCPMEGIVPAQFDEVLGLKNTDFSTSVACAAGYRHMEDAYSKLAKVRFSKEELIKRY